MRSCCQGCQQCITWRLLSKQPSRSRWEQQHQTAAAAAVAANLSRQRDGDDSTVRGSVLSCECVTCCCSFADVLLVAGVIKQLCVHFFCICVPLFSFTMAKEASLCRPRLCLVTTHIHIGFEVCHRGLLLTVCCCRVRHVDCSASTAVCRFVSVLASGCISRVKACNSPYARFG